MDAELELCLERIRASLAEELAELREWQALSAGHVPFQVSVCVQARIGELTKSLTSLS